MLWVVSAAFALQPQATEKSDFCGYVDWVGALLWGWSASYDVSLLNFAADFCYVAGLCHLPAPPWPQRQASLVPWKGKTNRAATSGTMNLIP
jgi:hypothetical protein